MRRILDVARAIVPRRARRYLRQRSRRARFEAAMRRLIRADGNLGDTLPESLVHELVYGWANETMSASEEFLQAVFRHASRSTGPILECGSGLSTLVLGVAARSSGQRVWSLENDPFWASVVRAALARYAITGVEICEAPLRSYGNFEWYELPHSHLARDFALVICDGPQGTTLGGRYGLLPVLGGNLRSGCVILLDDAARAGERQVLSRWGDEWHVSHEMIGGDKPFARLMVPGISSS